MRAEAGHSRPSRTTRAPETGPKTRGGTPMRNYRTKPALAAGILSAAALAFGGSSLAFGGAQHDPPNCDVQGMVINSNAPVVNGTPGSDLINGGPASQTINGRGGADVI